jgi:hypothetical protein
MPVLRPPNSSSLFTFRAAEWAFQIYNDADVPLFVRGLSKFEPVTDPTMQDDSDIDSEGWKSELVTAQKLNINFEGLMKGEKSGGVVTPDPGAALLRAKGKDKGYDNIVKARYWRTDDLNEAFEHFFAVKWTDVGGSNEDLQKFTGTLSGRGKPTAIAKPQAPETATSILVNPTAISLDDGEVFQLQVEDNNGINRTAEASFVSGTPATATVSSSGLVTAVAAGTSTITATLGALTDTCAVTVP